jgi:3-mercaptopropionate dioxygenase
VRAAEPRRQTVDTFITDVASLVAGGDDEYEITEQVAARLSGLLASGYRLPSEVTRPSNEHHVTYPLYIAPDDSWSLASVVWNVGQRTPVHGHETWCRRNLRGGRTRVPLRQARGVRAGRRADAGR